MFTNYMLCLAYMFKLIHTICCFFAPLAYYVCLLHMYALICIYIYIYLFIYLFVYLFIHMCVYIYIYIFVYLCIYLLFVYLHNSLLRVFLVYLIS